MKMLKYLFIVILSVGLIACSDKETEETSNTDTIENELVKKIPSDEQIVEIGCALCQMGLECDKCQLAVKIADNTYFLEGVDLDEEAEYELCSVIKKAKIKGKISDNKFIAQNFEFIKE